MPPAPPLVMPGAKIEQQERATATRARATGTEALNRVVRHARHGEESPTAHVVRQVRRYLHLGLATAVGTDIGSSRRRGCRGIPPCACGRSV